MAIPHRRRSALRPTPALTSTPSRFFPVFIQMMQVAKLKQHRAAIHVDNHAPMRTTYGAVFPRRASTRCQVGLAKDSRIRLEEQCSEVASIPNEWDGAPFKSNSIAQE